MAEEMDLGKLLVHIAGDKSELVEAIEGAKGEINAFLGEFGMVKEIAEYCYEAAEAFGKMAGEIHGAAIRTGIEAEELSKLSYAAVKTGSDVNELGYAIRMLQYHLTEAEKGGKGGNDAIKRLGLSARELKNMKPEQQFEAIAEAFKHMEQSQKASVGRHLFGYGYSRIVGLLNKGKDGIEALKKEAVDLNLVMSEDSIEAGTHFHHAMDTMHYALKLITYDIGGAVAPAIQFFAEMITESVGGIRDMIDGVKDLIGGLVNLWPPLKAVIEGFKWLREHGLKLTDFIPGMGYLIRAATLWKNIKKELMGDKEDAKEESNEMEQTTDMVKGHFKEIHGNAATDYSGSSSAEGGPAKAKELSVHAPRLENILTKIEKNTRNSGGIG